VTVETFDGNCAEHGAFTGKVFVLGTRRIASSCPQCTAAKQAAEVVASRKAFQAEALAVAGIPARHRGLSMGAYEPRGPEQTRHLANVRRWIDEACSPRAVAPLVLLGTAGRGKTHLAVVALDALAARGRSVGYTKASEVEAISRRGDQLAARRQHLANCRVVVLDELGLEAPTEFARAAVAQFVHDRYDLAWPLIVVSNLTPDGIFAAYGQGIEDRLLRDGYVLHFEGDSLRGAE
jgi:DNA replication protein DnaC